MRKGARNVMVAGLVNANTIQDHDGARLDTISITDTLTMYLVTLDTGGSYIFFTNSTDNSLFSLDVNDDILYKLAVACTRHIGALSNP